MFNTLRILFLLLCTLTLTSCKEDNWNNPHKNPHGADNIRYNSFSETPKTLDPARSYSTNEALFITQIYEPPLQYHYLKRPYILVPLTTTAMPKVTYLDAKQKPLSSKVAKNKIAYTVYDIYIKPGIFYQPHPAFAKKSNGEYYYQHLTKKNLVAINELKNFKHTGTRELTADDYVYEIKRLGDPRVGSPIQGFMRKYIVGLDGYTKTLQNIYQKNQKNANFFMDLRQYPLAGAKTIDRYHYQIITQGNYPQFIYWLAMPFFSPIPWEADYFYAQPGMSKNNLTFDWYPVGTGPYVLTENNPNHQMVLTRNPHFHGETYPTEGMPDDKTLGLLATAGKPLPMIDKAIFSLEKESIPRWNKFLQGYYDQSAIGSDSFDQAIQINANGEPNLTPEMQAKHIKLYTEISSGIYYLGFNMQDDVVGSYSEAARKLRQAISIAIDYPEFISIFLNGRGMPAQGPIPPGIFGHIDGKAGINPYIYAWIQNQPKLKSITYAKKLLAEAGYPDGINPKTGRALILNLDTMASGNPDDKAEFDWMRKQFAKLGIQLNVRSTLYNRFQEKIRTGNAQIYLWGWSADYPDPENFLFLLYGPNGKVKYGGENASNYQNPQFDRLYDQMRYLPNGPERQKIINQMVAILQIDTPWVWGFFPKEFVLSQQWNNPRKPSSIINNTLKYQSINPQLRAQLRDAWNRPHLWPLLIALLIFVIIAIPVIINYIRGEHKNKIKRF